MEISAWNSMNRARGLLSIAYHLAESTAKNASGDPSGMVAALATLLDLIENEVDDAMMLIPRDETAARAEAQTIDHRPAA